MGKLLLIYLELDELDSLMDTSLHPGYYMRKPSVSIIPWLRNSPLKSHMQFHLLRWEDIIQ